MKKSSIVKAILVIASFVLVSACSTSPRTTGYFLPYPIIEVTDGTAFYDGGSIVIHFVLADGSHWGLLMNKSMNEESHPDLYEALTISQNDYSESSKVQIKEMKLEIGSREEHEMLSLLCEFRRKQGPSKTHDPLYWVDVILEEKDYSPAIKDSATVDAFPPPEQIKELLYSLPEIDKVIYIQHEEGCPENPDIVPRYFYSGWTDVCVILQFIVDCNGSISYSQKLLGTYPPESEWFGDSLPVMIKVEKLIESEYGIPATSNYSEIWKKTHSQSMDLTGETPVD